MGYQGRVLLLLTATSVCAFSQTLLDSLRLCADSLHVRGRTFEGQHLYDSAQVYLSREIELREDMNDTLGLVEALSVLAWVSTLSSDYDSALTVSQHAMNIVQAKFGEDDTLTARIYSLVGKAYAGINNYTPAIQNLNRALDIRLKALGPNHRRVADARYDLGVYEFQFAHFDDALTHLSEAARIYLGFDTLEAAKSWQWIAVIHGAQGNLVLMDSAAQRSLELALAVVGDSSPQLIPFYGFAGQIYSGLGFEEKALGFRQRSLELARFEGSPWWLAISYQDLASTYYELGEIERAADLADSALSLYMETFGEESPRIWDYYSLLGEIRLKQGNIKEGLTLMTHAVSALRSLPEGAHPQMLASSLENLASAYRDAGDYEKAISYYEEALYVWEQSPVGTGMGAASTMDGLGMTYLEAGDAKKAFGYLKTSLFLGEQNVALAPVSLAASYSHLALAEKELGDDSLALEHARKAVEIFEHSSLRVGSEYRKSYTDKHREIYETYIDLLVRHGRFEEAFEVIERSKLKQLKESVEAKHLGLGEDELKAKITASQELALKQELLAEQLVAEQTKDTTEQVPEKIEQLSKLLAETKAEFFKVVSEIKCDPDYAFTVTVDPVLFATLRQELPEGQKLLMAYPGENELYLFLVSQSGYEARSVPVGRDSLTALVRECRRLCLDRGLTLLRQQNIHQWRWNDDGSPFYIEEVAPLKLVLEELYSLLVRPLEASLQDASVLTFIPSGELYYIPYGALAYESNDSLHFLCERIQWNVLTSAELLKCIQRRTFTAENTLDTLLLVGNPTGVNLPASEIETRAIFASYPASTLLAGDAATKEAVIEASRNTKVLHLATHCRLNPSSPWESYIQLAPHDTSDGRWTATEISGEDWGKMNLVTLSACETAVGSERPGLEWESVAKAFSLAMQDPPSIVATLWPVYDPSTKEFMISFYRALKQNTKASALAHSQSALARSKDYAHPFFWAGFMLIGEWR